MATRAAVACGPDACFDADALLGDRFCSRVCYHAYGRDATSPRLSAAWN